MKKLICAVYDKATEVYAHPFTCYNEAAAIRDFKHAVLDPECALSHAPDDFILQVLGGFDDETGIIESWDPFTTIAAGGSFKKE